MRCPTIRTLATLAATLTISMLAGCGGGGGAPLPPADGGGTTAGALSFGTLTAFGSVWVNGTEYDTSTATFRIDDSPASQSDLRVGMVVRVDGSADDGTASTVTVDGALKGRVEQVLDAHRMVVMGQTVRIDDQTRFENGIVPVRGDLVDVHGLVAGPGAIAAGFIERKASLPSFAVKGLVAGHDGAAGTFTIGTLRVSYGAGTTVNDMPPGSWNGLQVEVKGATCAGNPVCGTLAASKVEPAGLQFEDSARTEFEGFVISLSADGFMLGGQAVVVTAATRFEGGVAADVGVGTKLEVEGSLSAGVLTAGKVSLRDNIRLEGNVASIDAAAGTFKLAGLPLVTVRVDSLTRLDHLASLAALGVSNHVRVEGHASSGGAVSAIKLELRSTSADGRVVLQGPVTEFVAGVSLRILGTLVDTSGVADSEFKSHADAPIGRTAFFAAIQPGAIVKARGALAGGTAIGWDEMELED